MLEKKGGSQGGKKWSVERAPSAIAACNKDIEDFEKCKQMLKDKPIIEAQNEKRERHDMWLSDRNIQSEKEREVQKYNQWIKEVEDEKREKARRLEKEQKEKEKEHLKLLSIENNKEDKTEGTECSRKHEFQTTECRQQ